MKILKNIHVYDVNIQVLHQWHWHEEHMIISRVSAAELTTELFCKNIFVAQVHEMHM